MYLDNACWLLESLWFDVGYQFLLGEVLEEMTLDKEEHFELPHRLDEVRNVRPRKWHRNATNMESEKPSASTSPCLNTAFQSRSHEPIATRTNAPPTKRLTEAHASSQYNHTNGCRFEAASPLPRRSNVSPGLLTRSCSRGNSLLQRANWWSRTKAKPIVEIGDMEGRGRSGEGRKTDRTTKERRREATWNVLVNPVCAGRDESSRDIVCGRIGL